MQVFNSLEKTVVILTVEDVEIGGDIAKGFGIELLLVPATAKWNAFLSGLILTVKSRGGEIIYYIDNK